MPPIWCARASFCMAGWPGASENVARWIWRELKPRFERVLQRLPQERIDGLRPHHWRGELPGREVLIIVARHTAEHLAHAELTRDMALVALRGSLASRT